MRVYPINRSGTVKMLLVTSIHRGRAGALLMLVLPWPVFIPLQDK